MNRTAITCTTIAALGLLSAAYLTAGPLNPPAGPVASTYKTLAEVEPRIAISSVNTPGDADSVYRIAQRGSYYLTGNLAGVAGKASIIEIGVSDVTIDLSGFTIDGSSVATFGIVLDSSAEPDEITVRNGTIRACAASAVRLGWGQGSGSNYLVENMRAELNGTGIDVANESVIRHCQAIGNASKGILASSSIIESCLASGNGSDGFFIGTCSIRDCVANDNGALGFNVVLSTLSSCMTHGNADGGLRCSDSNVRGSTALDGMTLANRNIVIGNNCQRFGNSAMLVDGTDNRIEGNNLTNSSIGLGVIKPGNIIFRNTSSGNTINWSVVAGNALAPVVQAATNASNFTGNVYTGNLGSTDPNANFTF